MPVNLRLIGTGFGRTGTDSMREALNILGFGPCHHMRALIEDKEHEMTWRRFNAGGTKDWNVLFGDHQSCVDWPSAHYWPQLVEDFPDAKVLLTWRTADSWWASFSKTILPILESSTETEESDPGSQLIAARVFGGKPMTRDYCVATYEANVAKVKATIDPDRLLVYTIGDGWEPLCRHLNVPVPEMAFPRSNSTAEFQQELGASKKN